MKEQGNILITGAYGFLGTHIAAIFNKAGYRVYGLGHDGPTAKKTKMFFTKQLFGTVNQKAILDSNIRFACIIHCAGASSVSFVENNACVSEKTTVESMQEVLNYIKVYSPETKLVYISSAAVYGDTGNKLAEEHDSLKPISLYGSHKKMCEDLCAYYCERYHLDIKIIRPFSVCGTNLRKQLIWDACNKFTKNQDTFWGDGNECRDWIHVEDVARLVLSVFEKKAESCIFNASNGLAVKNSELLSYVAMHFSTNINVKFNGITNLSDPKNLVGSVDRLHNELNFTAKKSWRQIIDEYVLWYKNLKDEERA